MIVGREAESGGDFDVAVAGAGPAGAATARWLALRGCSVALLETSHYGRLRPGESLAPAIQPLLTGLGVWDAFQALRPLPCHGTRAFWGGDEPLEHAHLMNPHGSGWQVDRAEFDHMLAQAALEAGASLMLDTRVAGVEAEGQDAWRLSVRQDLGSPCRRLRARMVVDATGRTVRVARKLGGQSLSFDSLVGVAVLFEGQDMAEQGFVLVETTPDGWWYSAPAAPGRMMAMLMTDSDLCRQGRLTGLTSWLARIPPATNRRLLGGVMAWGPRLFPAASQRLQREDFSAPWLAVGDASLSVDPLRT